MEVPIMVMNGGIVTISYVIGGKGREMRRRDSETSLMGIMMTKGFVAARRCNVAPPRDPRGASRSATSTPYSASISIVSVIAPLSVLTVVLPPILATGGILAGRRGPTHPPRHFAALPLRDAYTMRLPNLQLRSPGTVAVHADTGALSTGSMAPPRLPTAAMRATKGRAITRATSLVTRMAPPVRKPSTLATLQSEVDCSSRQFVGGGRRLGRSANIAGHQGAVLAAVAALQFVGPPRGLGRPTTLSTI